MRYSDAQIMIQAIKNTGYKPNEWEAGLMQGLEDRLVDVLTYKQTIALERLYAKATGGGLYMNRQRI